ncbi:hypothetical protein OH146_13070 [Salinibacterium sp. SYSU T00001]|uniref:hypothetical protein n=1 Tax=Homoserinimonas sedimenticola TaxID=2986805 RepID=UPI002235A2F5|nr:hypothetical protein [Salinibacterium sedimenticola]MCW4386706.1 hypothetical protein [Salinibacterium sedimenticola]
MLVFRRYRRMLRPSLLVAFAVTAIVTVAFGGGYLTGNPAGVLGIALLAAMVSLGVTLASLAGAFVAVWIGDRRIEKSRARRVTLAGSGAGFAVLAVTLVLVALDRGAGMVDWSGAYLSVGLFCAVVAAGCAAVMAAIIEFPTVSPEE